MKTKSPDSNQLWSDLADWVNVAHLGMHAGQTYDVCIVIQMYTKTD